MRKEQSNIEPGNKIEEKDSRNECVLGGDEIEYEQADAGNGLAHAEPMRSQQFILQKVTFRATKRFQEHAKNEHAAIDAVAPPGQFGAGRMKRDHHPNTKPEKQRDHDDLAKQKEVVKTFRPLRDHDYWAWVEMRLRDGKIASTGAKFVAPMILVAFHPVDADLIAIRIP